MVRQVSRTHTQRQRLTRGLRYPAAVLNVDVEAKET